MAKNNITITTNIDGLLIKHEAFFEPHKAWFERAIAKTGNEGLRQWIGKKEYFPGVDIAMAMIMPDANEEERTKQAREWYQEDVIQYIKSHKVVYEDAVKALRKLKARFRVVLLTTKTREHIRDILRAAGINGLYNAIYATSVNEKPNTAYLFQRLIEKEGKPRFYIAGHGNDGFEEARKLGINSIYTVWDDHDLKIAELANQVVSSPEELENRLLSH